MMMIVATAIQLLVRENLMLDICCKLRMSDGNIQPLFVS